MLAGYIDVVTSAGFVEGWAFDSAAPAKPLTIAVLDPDGSEIAWGLAHRYRADLVDARCGIGWCAFQVRVLGGVGRLRRAALILRARASGQEIHRADPVRYVEQAEPRLTEISEVTRSDPTLLGGIDQLLGCRALLGGFLMRRGVEMFVRTAYVYVLGRPADPGGRALYGRLLRAGQLTPFDLLRTLYDSDEFRSRPRLLAAPNTASFPFHAD